MNAPCLCLSTQTAKFAADALECVLGEEQSLRDALVKMPLAWVRGAREVAVRPEDMEDDSRKCRVCHTTCHLSMLSCSCSKEVGTTHQLS